MVNVETYKDLEGNLITLTNLDHTGDCVKNVWSIIPGSAKVYINGVLVEHGDKKYDNKILLSFFSQTYEVDQKVEYRMYVVNGVSE